MALLEKGQSQGLTEKSTQDASNRSFYVGAAWDGDVDLDLMIVPVNNDGASIEDSVCYFSRLESLGGAIKHSGDALDGDAEGDDESIVINVNSIPDTVQALVVGVIAYNVADMSAASNTQFTIRDGADVAAAELFKLPMSDEDVEGETILVSCVIAREGDGWSVTSVSEFNTEFKHGIDSANGLVKIAPGFVGSNTAA